MEEKNRMINTRVWVDGYFSGLDRDSKLAWIYLLTNPYTDICGVYELPLKFMAIETDIGQDALLKIMARFEADGKVKYKDHWVAIRNFAKYQKAGGAKIRLGIAAALEGVPEGLKQWVNNSEKSAISNNSDIPYRYPADTPADKRKEKKRKEKKRKEVCGDGVAAQPPAETQELTLGQKADRAAKAFYKAYKDAGKGEYVASFGEDNKHMQALLGALTEAELQACIECYIKTQDAYYEKTGWTIRVFRANINAIKTRALKTAQGTKDYSGGF